MTPAKGPSPATVGAAVTAVGAAAVGAAIVEGLTRRRRRLAGLDPEGGYDLPPDEVHTIIATDGVHLHVEVSRPTESPDTPSGSPSDALPTVILAHGFTLNLDSWVFQRRALVEAGYRVVSWDQRGHGLSGDSDDEHASIEQLGHDLAMVIETLAPTGDLVLIGHSMGGMTIMSLAHHHPQIVRERVIAVGLIATSAGGEGLTDLDFGPLAGHLLGRVGPGLLHRLGSYAGPLYRLRRFGRKVEDAFVEHYSFASPVSQQLVRFCGDMIFATSFATMSQFMSAIQRNEEREALGTFIGIETLVINGSGDLLTRPDHNDDIVERVPGAEHVFVEKAGHLIQLEYPDLINYQLLQLITRGMRARTAGVAPASRPRITRAITDLARKRQVRRARQTVRAPASESEHGQDTNRQRSAATP